jgi:acyl-CoA synthetase (AMP-forming)/AMP-acid ligase II
MPFFHVHGIVAGLLAPLLSGGSVFCPPRFDALGFFAALKLAEATWYTAVPTMHQAILARAERHRGEKHSLRFVRSCSAPLASRVWRQLEEVFEAPVINAYGMTEAAHQVASNPLPPGSRKLGSVGCASGVEIAVLDHAGRPLPPCSEGQVALRGDRVMRGYLHNPEANSEAFINGWFLTGDLGQLDREGYLTLSGRLKEIINCGGEKISPLEIDKVLLEHPDIEQALTFPIPHKKLGEAVAAAVVLRQGSSVKESQIREFAARFLAHFKIPCQIVFVTDLPKGPTGKFQRNRVAAALGSPDIFADPNIPV